MRDNILYCFLFIIFSFSGCQTTYPPSIYDSSSKRLSDYENNYFVRILPGYSHSGSIVEAVDFQKVVALPKNVKGKYLFSRKDRMIGGFRLEQEIDHYDWLRALENIDDKYNRLNSFVLINNIVNQFNRTKVDQSKMEFKNYRGYLVVETVLSSEVGLSLAMKPYATVKGGEQDSVFVTFMFSQPSTSNEAVKKEFETLLENTVLSYFLNYERSVSKRYSFE